ncbi:MAG: GUN4 domain-containing protein [Coleofasciculus sp. C1-SOL-03]|uniref:GUN4 domain-containing protein n=1 Tax=Coleofasciculus sp. C1-SOL-03 TaxID=3069522 RepID=UPI0032F75E82
MGKSSLRVQMTKKLKAQGIKCASIDMTRIGSHVTPDEGYGGLVSELLRGFRLSRKINFSNWWRDREVLSPVQRLSEFIDDVLLIELSDNIVIFIDEIDSILKIQFKDDFFALIRACYNQRVDNPDYQRLTFCLLGVATPSDLIADKQRTPFNIGQAIELTGLTFAEAKSALIKGLQHHVENPEAVLTEVLDWTGGQPFLTQKLCSLIVQEWDTMGQEFHPDHSSTANEIEALVQTCIIENWEAWDEPEHLRTIRDRILANEQRAGRLLGLYQHILQQGQIPTDESPEQVELRLTGLVVRQQGNLRVYNPIYAGIFNHRWVEQELANLRPYSQGIRAWEVSNRQDKSRLLRGSALQEALNWAANKSLGVVDYAFLTESQQQELEAERQAKQILASAKQKAEQLLAEAKEGTRLERAGVNALQLFAAGGREIEALLAAMQAGQALLKRVTKSRSLPDYPATSPIFALQQILSQNGHRAPVRGVCFSPDGKFIASASGDHTARLWNVAGDLITEFVGHQGWVLSVCFSPNGDYIATGSGDGTAKLWDYQGNLLAQFTQSPSKITRVSFSPDGKRLATAASDGVARLWQVEGLEELLCRGCNNGEFCYVLNSRQMGKSSLRVQMTKRLKVQGVKCAAIDMTRIGSHVTPEEWYGGLVSELLRGFRLSRKINFSNWWRDREVLSPVQRLAGRGAKGWLSSDDIKQFPGKDLLTIDRLWVKYSQGRFGFSVQKRIWESIGGTENADYEIYCIFCKRVGWGDRLGLREFSWLSCSDLTYNTTAPVGHLPGGLLDWLWSSYRNSLLIASENANSATSPAWWTIIHALASKFSELSKADTK